MLTVFQTSAKKSLNKCEKDAITTYDKGLKDTALWCDKCFKKGDKIYSIITKATMKQVAYAIVSEDKVKIYESGDFIKEEKAEADEGDLSSKDLNSVTRVINLNH